MALGVGLALKLDRKPKCTGQTCDCTLGLEAWQLAFQQQDLIPGDLKVAIFRLGWQVTRFGKVRTMAASLLSGIGVVRMLKR